MLLSLSGFHLTSTLYFVDNKRAQWNAKKKRERKLNANKPKENKTLRKVAETTTLFEEESEQALLDSLFAQGFFVIKKPSLGHKSTRPKRTSFLLIFQNSTCSTLSVSSPTCFQTKLEGFLPLTRVNNKEVSLWNATLSASIQKDISPVGDNRASVLEPWEGVGAEDPTLGPEQLWGRQESCSCCRRAWGSTRVPRLQR